MANLISSAVASAVLLLSPAKENKTCRQDCAISDEGAQIIREFEGYSPFIYKDAVGLPTVGFGHLLRPGEKIKEPLMGPEAEMLLRADFKPVERGINKLVRVSLSQSRFDAMGSFTFNLGIGALQGSTLLRYVNLERHDDVPAQFRRWVFAGQPPKKLGGLVTRREAEAGLYSR